MKKFWAILLAMMLVLSMVTVAGATEVENPSTDAEGFTITVNPKDDVDHEYKCTRFSLLMLKQMQE